MAEHDLIAISQTLQGQPPSEPTGGTPQASEEKLNRTLAQRVRGWYLSDLASRYWKDYIAQAEIDEGYYIGGDRAWVDDEGSKTDLEYLKSHTRAHVSINHVKPIVKVLTGLERQTRLDLTVLPEGEEDEEDARLMSWLMKWVQKQAHIPELRSEAFKQGPCIRGMSVLTCEIDYTDSPVTGDIVCEVLTPGKDCIWDPNSKKAGFEDANHFIRWRWAWVDDVVAMYPDKQDAIKDALQRLGTTMTTEGGGISRTIPGDDYGSVARHPDEAPNPGMFYDPDLGRVLLLEAWWPVYEKAYYVHNKLAGKVLDAPNVTAARDIVNADPKNMVLIERPIRYICTGTVLPATGITLEEGDSPYENDDKDYPFVKEVGEQVGNDVRGVVRDLRDAQRVENKRISQALDIASRMSKIRRVAVEGSIAPQSLQALDDPLAESTIFVRSGFDMPRYDTPAGISEVVKLLMEIGGSMSTNMREQSGVNPDLQGLRQESGSSGIAIARRQAQGQVIATELYDNHRLAGQIFGKRLGRRIQQKFTKEEFIRLTNDIGATELVHLNPPDFVNADRERRRTLRSELKMQGKPAVLADLSKFKWDLTISETPASPTARAEAADVLMQLMERMPALAPILAPTVIKMTEGLPDKPQILQKLEMLQGGPPPQPGTQVPGQPPMPVPPPPPTPGQPPPPQTQPGVAPGETATTVAPLPPGVGT